MVKLCDTFSKKIVVHMDIFWHFFINFYSAYSPAVKNKQFSQNTIDLFRSLICNCLEDFLNKLVQFEEFYNVQLLETLIENTDCSLGFILVTNKVLQKLVSNHNDTVTRVNIVLYLDMIFTALTKCYILLMKEDKLYAQLLISAAHLISRSSNEQFAEIEVILCKNLVAPYLWNSLLAYDTWITVCRVSNMEYRFEVLVWMIENFQQILRTHNTFRPQFIILSNFIGELFCLLSTDYKLSFIRKYSLNTNHLFVWKHIGLKYIPNSCLTLVQNHLSHMCDRMEKFSIGKCTYADYLIMVTLYT
ncbi:hypothetical protein AMK59_1968 [Oryctes borbonicus]|uniref:Uncharacterized protein n=1 Tax=Oryctes borbonicus TaxID=1629725 RepID=A0A0T6BHI2_9SCAR|nr:hypothetical protein AMK59_1968 [Oryctes borbonicus]